MRRSSLQAEPAAPAAFRYSAFISYNHRDAKFAAWLLKQLEGYRIPPRIRGRDSGLGVLGERLPPVFRDREELSASPDLAQSVRDALDVSAHLIVICSPNSAKSRWVNEEIRHFTRLGRRNRVQCLIVGGEPNAARMVGADPDLECLPPALFENGGQEPLAADIRPGHDPRAVARLKLVAGLIGVGYDELAQREAHRRQRRLLLALGAASTGFVAMAGLATFALISRADAVKQRDIARQKTITAERTVDFVKSLFMVSDPSEAQGETITAREILDRGAKRITTELANEPTVRAELSTTLGEVYAGLGLYRQSEALLRVANGLAGVDPATRARQSAALGEAHMRQGRYEEAIAAHQTGLNQLKAVPGQAPEVEARLLIGLGEAQSAIDRFDAADASITRALKLETVRLPAGDPGLARPIEALALNAYFGGRPDDARRLMEQALAIRLKAQGDRHPKVSEDLNLLGVIAYEQRDSRAAEAWYRRALAADRVVLGPDHPDLAITTNNLARVVLERRGFAEARDMFQRVISLSLRERDATFDDFAFYFANLALAEQGLGNLDEADLQFQKAWAAADLHNHRNRGPILADRADIACTQGRSAEGLALLARAQPLMKADYPDDAWRSAWVTAVRGRCLAAAGDKPAARAALATAAPAIRERWAPGTLYAERLKGFEAAAS